MRKIKLKNNTLNLFNENSSNSNQNSVRITYDFQNVVLPNQEINNVAKIIEKNFLFVYDFYSSNIDNNIKEISTSFVEEISIKIVLNYLYMYNMWRISYKNQSNLILDFDEKDFHNPDTADIIFDYSKKKYPNDWLEKSAAILGKDKASTLQYYRERKLSNNK